MKRRDAVPANGVLAADVRKYAVSDSWSRSAVVYPAHGFAERPLRHDVRAIRP